MPTPPLDSKLVRERLLRFLKVSRDPEQPITQTAVAKGIGCSGPLISAFLNEDYRGNIPRLCQRITAYLDEQELKATAGALALPAVETRQIKVALQCLEVAQIQHWIIAIISESGHGKTFAIDRYLTDHPSTILLRPWVQSSTSTLLKDLCKEIGESETGTMRAFRKSIVHRLKGTDRLLIIDDAHDLSPTSLQVVRNIYDDTGIGIALVGNSPLETKLAGVTPELEQLARRVMYKRRLPAWTDADAKQQIAKTLPHLDAGQVLAAFHPKAKQSPSWVAKTILAAGKLTDAEDLRGVTMERLRDALEMVA